MINHPKPIRIQCEGSLQKPASRTIPLCAMCGEYILLLAHGVMPVHDRDDVLAMLDRGDYDGGYGGG